MYYLAFPKDRTLIKLAVAWVYLVGISQTVLAMVDIINTLGFTLGPGTGESPNTIHIWYTIVISSATGEKSPVLVKGVLC